MTNIRSDRCIYVWYYFGCWCKSILLWWTFSKNRILKLKRMLDKRPIPWLALRDYKWRLLHLLYDFVNNPYCWIISLLVDQLTIVLSFLSVGGGREQTSFFIIVMIPLVTFPCSVVGQVNCNARLVREVVARSMRQVGTKDQDWSLISHTVSNMLLL